MLKSVCVCVCVCVSQERTKMLDAKERDAAKEQELASKGAKEAAAEAQRLAAQAAERAKVAVKAGRAAQVRPLPLKRDLSSRSLFHTSFFLSSLRRGGARQRGSFGTVTGSLLAL